MAVSAVLTSLQAAREDLAETVATEMAYQAANGARASYSVGGRSVSWTEWLRSSLDSLKEMDEAIQRLSGPTMIFTRGRA